MASRFSRALGVLRRAQRSHGSHGAIVPLGARPHGPHLNALAAAGIVLGSSLVSCKEKKATKATKVEVKEEKKEKKQLAPGYKPGEPEIKFADVKKHNSIDKGIWVTYRDGVYDITKFVQNHPGGLERILKAAGGQIDPFWAMYAQHNVASVKDILGEHRIGHLSEVEYKNLPPPFDPYQMDPKRDPELLVQAAKPFNAECPLSQLAKQEYLTPNEKFFVRNHLPVPTGDIVDPKKYVLEIIPGEDQEPVKLTLADLQDEKRFKRKKVSAIVQCSGNRREDQNSVAQVEGLTWYTGAISNAEWEGDEFDGTYISAPWSTPKIPRTFSTPGYAGQVSGGAGVTGELSPFPPLLLGRSLSHALPSLGPNGSQGLPASINALFQPGVFQFQCDPPDNSKPAPAPEPIRQASEPIAAPKPKASSTPSGQMPVQGAPTMPGQESRTVPPLPARGRQGVTHRHRNEVGLCQEPAFSTMQLEQCAAQCRKEVEAIAARCRAEGQKFNDPDFPAAKTSLFASTPSSSFFGAGATNASWRREAEVEGQWKTEDSPAVLHVGALGSFPLQGALATMQSMGKDPKELIVWHEPEAGVYGVRFFKDGEWMYEVLDDNLPVSQNGRPLYSSCGHEQQDWAALIEKGYAKLHGSYEAATNCQEEDTLEDVLGVASGRISVGDFPVWAELWQHLRSKCKRRYALAAIRRRERPGEVLTSGLLGGCAYPVLSLDVVNGHALVALENPWPQGKWNGSWGPDSLEVLRCGLKQQPGNTFWMSIQDFCQHFTDVTEARLIPSSWQSAMVSMSEERPSYPLVSVSSPTQAIFCLTQADSRLRTNRNFAAIGLRVYRCRIVAPPQHSTGAKQNVSNPFKPLELLAEKLASKVHSVTVEIPKLEPNCLYVASTVTSPEASPDFAVLRVLTSMPMRFRELSVPESAYFLQAEEQAVPAVDTDSFSSQGSAEDHAQEPAREDAMKAAVADSRATGSAVSESCQGSEVSENWPGECGTEVDLGFDLKLPPFLEDMLKHCSGIDC